MHKKVTIGDKTLQDDMLMQKQLIGFIIRTDERLYPRLSFHTHTHTHTRGAAGECMTHCLCAQESCDRKTQVSLASRGCLKWEARHRRRADMRKKERNTVKPHSSHVATCAGYTWLLKTETHKPELCSEATEFGGSLFQYLLPMNF